MMRCAIEISMRGPILECQLLLRQEQRVVHGGREAWIINSSSMTIAGSADVDLKY